MNRTALTARVRELVADACTPLVDDLVDVAINITRDAIHEASDAVQDVFARALEQMTSITTEEPADEERTVEDAPIAPDPQPRARTPRAARADAAPLDEDARDRGESDRPRAPSRPACSKCGQPGHNARSCGRAPKGKPHAKLEAPPSPALAEEIGGDAKSVVIPSAPTTSPPPSQLSKSDRFARIEAAAASRRAGAVE